MLWIPVVFLLVLPAGWLAARFDLWQKPLFRLPAAIVSVVMVLWAMPWKGVDFEQLKHVKMLLAAAASLVLARHALRPFKKRRLDWILGLLACLSLLNYTNYFSFHGLGTFVHLHDVAHYYLGGKYYAELGYGDLYTAVLRAEAENHDNRFKVLEARDLNTYKRVHIRQLLQQSDEVKERFSDQRWLQFRLDAEYFRRSLGPHYGKFLLDHGFNPTPVWAWLGAGLAQRVAAGSPAGIFALCLLDPLLLALTFAMVAWAFGRRAAALSVLYFCVVFGSTFGWVGGAFLRYPWFLGVVGSFCLLKKGRYGWAGALIAPAVMLRVFPIFFVAPLAAKGLWTLVRRSTGPAAKPWSRRVPGRYVRYGLAFAGVSVALFATTLSLPKGLGHWQDFNANMQLHLRNIAPNVIGTTEALAHGWGAQRQVTEQEFEALKVRRYRIHRLQQALLFLPLVVWVAWSCRRRGDLAAVLLALPMLLTGLSLAAYYYVFLVLLVIYFRRRADLLAVIFGFEALSFALRLFEDSDGRLFVYRTVLVLWLYTYLYFSSKGLSVDAEPDSEPA